MLTDEQRIKIYGSVERVAQVDAQIQANAAAMPPLTPRQRDALRILLRPNSAVPAQSRKTQTAPLPQGAVA